MSEFTISFGYLGTQNTWYLRTGPDGFRPIDIALLPGPKPTFTPIRDQLVVSYTQEAFAGELLYDDKVLGDTADDTTTFDQLGYWNTTKNVQILSEEAQSLVFDGFVHVDAEIGLDDTAATSLILNGTKRANVITGLGDDLIDIRMVSDRNSIWQDTFRVATGEGKDTVLISGLDTAAEIAAGDRTFVRALNKPGLSLDPTGEGRSTWVATGADDDRIVGFTSDDNIIAGTDDGTIAKVFQNKAPSGFAYAVGGSTAKGKCDSILYKIDLKTGASAAIGEVQIDLGKWGSIGGLDIESLSLSPVDGQLYGFVSKFGILDALVRIDPVTAKTTFINLNCTGLRSELQDMAFAADGTLYFVSNCDFMKVNVTTGAITRIGNNTVDGKIGALAVDPLSGKVYGLANLGNKGTVLYEIDKTTGKTLSSNKISGLDGCGAIEGMSFDSAGVLWAVDRASGQIVKIDPATKSAVLVAKTLTDAKQYGDGFEALTMSTVADKKLVDLKALGGDTITTGAGADHLYYGAGDGVDTVTDFDLAADKLHITGYDASAIRVDVFEGNTYIRFADGSADGYVDDAMIALVGVTAFDPATILYTAPPA